MRKHLSFPRFVVVFALIVLLLNGLQGDFIGFKAFVNERDSLMRMNLSLTSRYREAQEGDTVILNRFESYFKGTLIQSGSQPYVNQGNVSVPLENERVYTEFLNINILVTLTIGVGLVVLKRSNVWKTHKKQKN